MHNYLVPKDGTPLGGLIQDQVISGVKLSIRGRFFNREDYQQLVFQGVSQVKGQIRLLPPAIIKPLKLWSGKQVCSSVKPSNNKNSSMIILFYRFCRQSF